MANDTTNTLTRQAIDLLRQAADASEGKGRADALRADADIVYRQLPEGIEEWRQDRARREAEKAERPKFVSQEYYLYCLPDGAQRVFELSRYSDDSAHHVATYYTFDKPPRYGKTRFADDRLPDDVREAGTALTQEEAWEMTGYYLPGSQTLQEATFAMERIREDDEHFLVCQTVSAIISGLTPDVIGIDRGNIYAKRLVDEKGELPSFFW